MTGIVRPGFFDQQDASHLNSKSRSDRIRFGASDKRSLTQRLGLGLLLIL